MNEAARNGMSVDLAWARDSFALEVEAELPLAGITGVFGPSGAGKSTLLRCLAGLERPDRLEFHIGDDVIESTRSGIRTPVHERRTGYVFQAPRLFGHLDVAGNLDYAVRRRRDRSGPGRDDVIGLLDLEPLLQRRTQGLSGGEAQRVAIGRALLCAPRLLLMDEPVSALDVARRGEVLPFIEKVHAEFGVPILYVSHAIDEISLLCDQLVVLDGGRTIASGDLSCVLLRTDLPVLGGDEAGVVVRARVLDYDDAYDMTRVAIDGGSLWLTGRHAASHLGLRVRIRASDVSLATTRSEGTSILNTLDVTVAGIERESAHSLLVRLEAGGTHILSRITRKSGENLAISPGMTLVAQIKSVSVRRASL